MDIHIHIDDRLVAAVKRLAGGKRGVVLTIVGVLATAGALYATSATPPNTFVSGTTISSSQVNTQFQQLYAGLNAVEGQVTTMQPFVGATVPPGAIVAFGGVTPPSGWLLCDGTEVSRTGTTAALFAVVGIAHGSGDGSTTFNLPDYRGRFLRGHDGGAGHDPDRLTRTAPTTGATVGDVVGSLQGSEILSHSHLIYANAVSSGGGGPIQWGLPPGSHDHGLANLFPSSGLTWTVDAYGGNETRPVNAAVNYMIKL